MDNRRKRSVQGPSDWLNGFDYTILLVWVSVFLCPKTVYWDKSLSFLPIFYPNRKEYLSKIISLTVVQKTGSIFHFSFGYHEKDTCNFIKSETGKMYLPFNPWLVLNQCSVN
jgi:hypothetical protein